MKQWKKYLGCLLAAVMVGTAVPANIPGEQVLPVEVQAAEVPELSATKLTLKVGEKAALELKNVDDGETVKWKSKKKKIAKVSSDGVVTAVKAGTTKVIAVYNGTKYVCKVTVQNAGSKYTEAEKKELAKTASGREKLAKAEAEAIIKAEGINTLKSDVAKVKAVHDYLVLNAEYDFENLLNNTIPDTSFEAYGIIVLKTGVCDSYTKAFQIFMDILGIPCERVTGTGNGGNHAWNVVTLDGERYHIDLTWDDPVPDVPGRVSYNYFLLDDATMKQDHSWSSSVKACKGTKYRMYPYEAAGQKADTLEEAKAIIRSQCVAKGVYAVQLLVPKDMLTLDDIVNYVQELNPDCNHCHWSYYPPVEVGEYYFYDVTVEVS